MANDIRGEVEFEANGKTWTLKLGNGAVRHIENETGKTFPQVGAELSNESTASITLLTQVFRAGLKGRHPEITMAECDDILDDIGHEEAGILLGRAVELMQRKGAKGGEGRPPQAAAG